MPSILSTLRSVLAQGVEIQLKILQTLVSLLTNCKDIHGDTMAEVSHCNAADPARCLRGD